MHSALSITPLSNGERIKSKKFNMYEQEREDLARERDEVRMLRSFRDKILKAYKHKNFCDVVIKGKDGVETKAHKLVLGTHSHYFYKMFKTEEEGEKLNEVTIKEFNGEVIQAIVDCIYTHRVKRSLVTRENSKQMLEAGMVFDVETVKEEAAMYMAKHLDESNAIDLLTHDIFTGSVANSAFRYIGEHFQVFLDNKELEKRLIAEMNVDTIINLLQQKYLMLWHPNGLYLNGIEREKKLFFFVMAYVSQDKEARLPELPRLLKALKLPLLAASKVLNIHVMGEGLKVKPEELSGQLANVLEPFDDVTGKENLSTMFVTERKSEDKARSATETRALAETCKMRFATLPHSTSCSDLIQVNIPWSDRVTYCPENTENTVLYSTTKIIKAITVCKQNQGETVAEKQRISGIKIKWDDDSEESLGATDGENKVEETYDLGEGDLITEIMTYHKRGFFANAAVQHEFSTLSQVHDIAFTTNKQKMVGPMESSKHSMDIGLRLKVPAKLRYLEKECPGVFYWLQGFGLEEMKDDAGKTVIFYPIWGFQTHFKCYELNKQDFEFVAGIKKCYQFSVEGMSENPMINTLEDINSLERTPVHEVVDLGDSDEDDEPRAGPSMVNDDSIMMIDSDSEHTEDGSDVEDEEDSDDDFDEEENAGLLAAGILEVESGEEVGHGTDSPFNADILDEDDDDDDEDNEPVGQPKGFSNELIEIPSSSEPDQEPPNMEDVSEEILDDENESDKNEKEEDKTKSDKNEKENDKTLNGSKESRKEKDMEEKSVEASEKDTDDKKKSSSKISTNSESSTETEKGNKKEDTETEIEKGEEEETNKEAKLSETQSTGDQKEDKVQDKSEDSKSSRSKKGKSVEKETEEKKTLDQTSTEQTKEKDSPSKNKSQEKTDEEPKSETKSKESPSKKKAMEKQVKEVEEEPKSSKRQRTSASASSVTGRRSVSEEKAEESKTAKRKKR